MRVLAKRGERLYLVTQSGDNINPPSKLVDLDRQAAKAMPAQQALKWGYWEPVETTTDELFRTLKRIAYGIV